MCSFYQFYQLSTCIDIEDQLHQPFGQDSPLPHQVLDIMISSGDSDSYTTDASKKTQVHLSLVMNEKTISSTDPKNIELQIDMSPTSPIEQNTCMGKNYKDPPSSMKSSSSPFERNTAWSLLEKPFSVEKETQDMTQLHQIDDESKTSMKEMDLENVTVQLFETEQTIQKAIEKEHLRSLGDEEKSDATNSHPSQEECFQANTISVESEGKLLIRNDEKTAMNDDDDDDEYEGGMYSLRYDAFLPTNQHIKSKSNSITVSRSSRSLEKHQVLFDNLDSSFEKIPSSSCEENSKSISVCSVTELKDVTKMCFAAIAVVFSSFNPSVTTISNAEIEDTLGSSSHQECEVSVNKESDRDLKNIQSTNQRLDMTSSITSRHQSNLTKSAAGRIQTSNLKLPRVPSVASLVSGVSDEKMEPDHGSAKQSDESASDTLLDEDTDTTNTFVDNMEPIQRPSVPFVVVSMLWKKLIQCYLYDRDVRELEQEMETIIKFVQSYLTEELGFLEKVTFTPVIPYQVSKDEDQLVKRDEDEMFDEVNCVECIQVSHDVHLQYGRYISKNGSQYFPFYLDEGIRKKMRLHRSYFEDTWSPEEALNAIMAKICLKVFRKNSSSLADDFKGNLVDQIQFEYSIEMLPWHLLRAVLYRDAIGLLTDYSFVTNRMKVLEMRNAAQMHIADAEELYSCINSFIVKNPNVLVDFNIDQILVESYKLVGGVIQSEDPTKWEDEELADQDADGNNHVVSFETFNILSISKVLQALGDSLSRHNLNTDAMKFYYRAMLKYEYLSSKIREGIVDPQTKRSKLGTSDLLMGGILSRIASVYEWQKNNVEAMLCYERALSFYSRHKSKKHCKGIAKVLASMGEMHLNMKEYDAALSCSQESLTLWKAMDENVADDIANLNILMGHVNREIGNHNEALINFSEAMYDKISVYGKFHPEVGFLHQTIGVVYCDKGEHQKGLLHFEDALRIRESALKLVLSRVNCRYNDADERIQAREIEVAECMNYIGKVYETSGDFELSFSNFVASVSIYRSHLLAAVSNQASIMVSDLTNFLNEKSGESSELSVLYKHLVQAIKVGKDIYDIDNEKESEVNIDNFIEMESQIAEILYDLGLIEGAQYLLSLSKCSEGAIGQLNESLRRDAKTHFEQSVIIRKRILKRLQDFEEDEENSHMIDYEKITIAIILYELGNLCCCHEKNIEENGFKRRNSLGTRMFANKEHSSAISFFEEAHDILEKSIDMAETLDYINYEDDCYISRLHKTPEIYEDMLHTMAVLYRKSGDYDKSVECYNRVSILLTTTELDGDDQEKEKADNSMLTCQKAKVADSSQSIGDILFDTGEYSRALKSYDEALQLRRTFDNNSCIVADTLCLKGNVLLKMKQWDSAILAFDEAFRIRVDKLPQDHKDIAECFHLIGKAYEGDGKLEQALEYYKKGQRIFSGHLVDTDIDAADLFFDLGNIILQQDLLSKHFNCQQPSEDDISLALTCLALCRDIYRRNFGVEALELGNALNLLGLIHAKYHEYSKAVSYFESALKIFHGAPLDQSLKIASCLNNLASALMSSTVYDDDMVVNYLLLAKHTYEDKGSCKIESYADVMFNLGEAKFKSGKRFLISFIWLSVLMTISLFYFMLFLSR